MLPWVIIAVGVMALFAYRFMSSEGTSFGFNGINQSRNVSLPPTRTLMSVFVSVAILVSALYIILSKNYDGASEKWAFGAIGMIVGFWLKDGK